MCILHNLRCARLKPPVRVQQDSVTLQHLSTYDVIPEECTEFN